ncbi:Fc.00g042840.m01.CDS01 [Cosmosporella sp. VM-42]
MAGNIPHFWDDGQLSWSMIGAIASKGPSYQYEDVVCHAWTAIPGVYFNAHQVAGLQYAVTREAYRGVDPDHPDRTKPDVVVIRIQSTAQPPGFPPSVSQRDILWIECKQPRLTNPGGWKLVMSEIVDRLSASHQHGKVYVILAVGLKWMPFLWDPVPPLMNPAGGPLHILKANNQEAWPVDPRMHMISQTHLPGQRHIIQGSAGDLYVDTRQAYSLDFWSLDQLGNRAYLQDLVLLESFFDIIQRTQYQGQNPW